jgi:UDP-glucuronate 4-epimerase
MQGDIYTKEKNMKILVTGVAGFIGMHVAKLLLQRGESVLGIDNLNNYYDPRLKIARIELLKSHANFKFYQIDISDRQAIETIFANEKPLRVINLAAQAGVRYSIENPYAYIQSNLVGFSNILEGCRHNNVEHLVYASSSSVYGSNTNLPFSVSDNVDHPVSLYAATKKSNELLAHAYSHLYGLPTTGLRYFTVYGPWGRPDMAPWLFTSAILERRPINIYNMGKMKRDFTFVADISEATVRICDRIPTGNPTFNTGAPDPSSSHAPYKIYNIGNQQPIELMTFVKAIEKVVGLNAIINQLPMQPGDVVSTYADTSDLYSDIGFQPKTLLVDGISEWCKWYQDYMKEIGH